MVIEPTIIFHIKSLDIAISSWDDEPSICHWLVLNRGTTETVKFCATKWVILNSNRVLDLPSTRKVFCYITPLFSQSTFSNWGAEVSDLGKVDELISITTHILHSRRNELLEEKLTFYIKSHWLRQIRQWNWHKPCEEKKISDELDAGYAPTMSERFWKNDSISWQKR